MRSAMIAVIILMLVCLYTFTADATASSHAEEMDQHGAMGSFDQTNVCYYYNLASRGSRKSK